MKVSMKGDYGVRALVELAHRYGEGQVQSAAIANAQSIPEPYLDQLLTTLRRAGFIRSVRGPQGTTCASVRSSPRSRARWRPSPAWTTPRAAARRRVVVSALSGRRSRPQP